MRGRKVSMIGVEGRRSRVETVVQLRKRKKEQLMKIKRKQNLSMSVFATDNHEDNIVFQKILTIRMIMHIYHQWSTDSESMTVEKLYEVTRELRHLVTIGESLIMEEAVRCGAVTYLVSLLGTDSPLLQFEAAWALTNIASSKFCSEIADSGAVHYLAEMLYNDIPELREQAAWCVGNLVGDSSDYRDAVLNYKDKLIVNGLIQNLESPQNISLLSTVTFAVSNLCRGLPSPDPILIKGFARPLVSLLEKIQMFDELRSSTNIRTNACWALFNLSCHGDELAQVVLDAGAMSCFVGVLGRFQHEDSSMIPSIRAIGNFVAGNQKQTELVLGSGFLDLVNDLLDHPSKSVRKDTCWALSNIAAGTPTQIETIFATQFVAQKLVTLAEDSPHDIRKEAIWCLCNIITTGTEKHVQKLISMNVTEVFSQCLCKMTMEHRLIKIVLAALDVILADPDNRQAWVDSGGLGNVEKLQEHKDGEIYNHAICLMDKYFGGQCQEDYENIAPAAQDTEFVFGIQSKRNEGNTGMIPTFKFTSSTAFIDVLKNP